MITLCWGAKGGSGVTTVAAALALSRRRPTVLLDLDGDAALAIGLGDDGGPTLDDWLESDASADRVMRLARHVRDDVQLVPSRRRIDRAHGRWGDLARAAAAIGHDVVVDAGTGPPPATFQAIADVSLLVIRPCYLALTRAQRSSARPHGVVLVDEPGRALRPDDISAALGAPVVAVVSYDPKIARAVDSGLAVSRLPATCIRQLRNAA
ncbi:MinD-like ATPase involved in chromosome partitioning or flagellar assembly [Ilumatobacter fluminis]|uniref:MinD-like ATPase involved in chromosome partitioning or flagellar assembly n=1 Tax=Ilumatobacter fluminis TaxID=467091 RepID=A0A4R7HXM4_9ACTN|nr:hypothetical protein [Ilumatobacter fluminis]TDT15209.1 MinD-like ATPase involved in chromosome partitioning or flagellar assembly [Ilumatobacter fluminis]